LKVNKYMSMSRHHNKRQNYNKDTVNIPFENVAKFVCLGMAVRKQKLHSRVQ